MSFSWFQLPTKKSGATKPPRPTTRSVDIDIDGQKRPVAVVENPRTKRLTLRLMPGSAGLKLTVPPRTPERDIREFLNRNKAWAAARLSRLPDVIQLEEGALVPFRGVEHLICTSGQMRGIVKHQMVDNQHSLIVPGQPEHVARRLTDFFKKEARAALTERSHIHAKTLGVKIAGISIRDTTSRWGSCSSSRRLSYSWRIILAPPDVLDYLAAHEVSHLREMNHSPRFWAHVKSICPHMETSKAWLRTNGALLHAVGGVQS
ncbi:MAG: SprT family zinc-dependent metalloprotease [Pseudomonadota bacterium]